METHEQRTFDNVRLGSLVTDSTDVYDSESDRLPVKKKKKNRRVDNVSKR